MVKSMLAMAVFCIFAHVALAFVDVLAASLELDGTAGTSAMRTMKFVPSVAFHCGNLNQFLAQNGSWVSDRDPHATCLFGKLDILKYCRKIKSVLQNSLMVRPPGRPCSNWVVSVFGEPKVYPELDITNIVENNFKIPVSNWCNFDGTCKWSFLVQPYRCIVGEFESEALLVPDGCHFGHVDNHAKCEDLSYWNVTAQSECSRRHPSLSLKSFSILEPCGLDIFSGVEYVCCPKDGMSETAAGAQTKRIMEDVSSSKSSDEEDTTAEPVSRIASASHASLRKSSESEEDSETVASRDSYFRFADPEQEHDRYTAALKRLEHKHRSKVAKVMEEWAELDTRYQELKKKDPKPAETFRNEMTLRFRKTVSALEQENKEERQQLMDVHQQRVMSVLNERKRQAIQDYRLALEMSKHNGQQPKAHKVLKALEQYIRAEEKDRLHTLNHYQHLMRVDPSAALKIKDETVQRLHDISLRVNGTIDMLRDVPGLAMKIQPIILSFWQNYRKENSPSIAAIGSALNQDKQPDKLLDLYREQILRAASNTGKEDTGERDSDEDESGDDDDSQSSEEESARAVNEQKADKKATLLVDISRVEVHQEAGDVMPAFAKKESLVHQAQIIESSDANLQDSGRYQTGLALAVVSLIAVTIFGILMLKRWRSNHSHGFIAVDMHSPEEKHVVTMQSNGYENPTYRYFESN